jgi:S1-C subfamily serine protease
VISAIGRADVGIEDYEDFIQTDASINPGNSGGPLLNIYGEVVGINTAIVASGQGIGFAIPINLAELIARQLIDTGEVSRGWLGVSIQPMTPELATSFGLDRQTGVLVNQVLADGPAAQAGIRRGDILLTLGGKEVRGVRELQLLVASTPAGEMVAVEVLRDGKRQSFQVRVAPQEASSAAAATPADQDEAFGLSVVAEPGSGVEVVAVDPNGAAAQAGVQPGDLILAVNQQEVSDLDSFQRAAKRAQKSRSVVLLIQRDQMTLYVAFPLR